MKRHPVVSGPITRPDATIPVKVKRTGAIGYISFTVKYHSYMSIPTDIYVVCPPTPHNKQTANIKVYSGGVYHAEDLLRLKGKI